MNKVFVISDSREGVIRAATTMDKAITNAIQRIALMEAFCTEFDYDSSITTISYRLPQRFGTTVIEDEEVITITAVTVSDI